MVNIEALEGQYIYLAKKEAWKADDMATQELLQGVPVDQDQPAANGPLRMPAQSFLQKVLNKIILGEDL